MKFLFKLTGLTFVIAQFAGSPVLFGQVAPDAAKPKGARIQFSETTFDFGKITPSSTPRHDFTVTNTGDAVLEIVAVQPGCGCTTAGDWDHKIEPGKTGKIPIGFNPSSYSGPISKSITVSCNDVVQGTHVLQITATVFRPIDMQPPFVSFSPVEGEDVNDTKVIRIVNNADEELKLEPAVSSNPLFKTEIKTVKPGKEFELHVTAAATGPNPNLSGNITIKTSITNMETLTINAFAIPQPALMAIPQQIQLPVGPLTVENRFPAMIRNNAKTPVKLSEPSVNADGVTAQLQENEPGKSFTVNLTFPTGFQAQPGKPVELAVKTTHPKYPVLKVPIIQPAPPAPAVPPPAAAK